MFNKNVFTQKDPLADLIKGINEADYKAKMEALKGNQHKIDKNKNNKVDADDFKILGGEKKVNEDQVEEAAESPFTSWKKPRQPEPSGGSGVKQGSRYGGSKQKDKPEQDDEKVKKEETELEEAKFDALKHVKNPSPAVKAAAKDVKRSSYADRAALMKAGGVKDDRGPRGVTQEEVDQLDELSKGTLGSYVGKAYKDQGERMAKTGVLVGLHSAEHGKAPTIKQTKKIIGKDEVRKDKNRDAGMDRAVSRLSKEEVEELEEAEALIENYEIINEVSVGAKIRAYAQHSSDAFDHHDMGNSDEGEHHDNRADKILAHIEKHHGAEAVKHAQKAAHSAIFGRGGHSRGSDSLSGGLRGALQKTITKAGKIPKNTQSAVVNQRKTYGSRVTGPKGSLPEEVEMNERELSKGETAEKERIVKGMKKSLAGFKARYGDKAKSVMYATATARAKKD